MTAPEAAKGRRATWFELFFDLVFVAGVARLSAALAADFSPAGLARFAALFLVLWWCWVAHTFYATRFDRDTPAQRVLGLAKVACVVVIAYAAPGALEGRGTAFGLGVAGFKALLALAYLTAPGSHDGSQEARRVARLYALILGIGALLWSAGAAASGIAPRLGAWGLALALDVASPFLVTRYTHAAPPHPEHLPERFGLFTIILLGETVAALVHALDHLPEITGRDVAITALAVLLPFLFWWGYFDNARGAGERVVRTTADARRLQVWAYAHIPLFFGTALMAVGGRQVVEHHLAPGWGAWLLCFGSAAAIVALTLIGASHGGRPMRQHRAVIFGSGAAGAASCALAEPSLGGEGVLLLLVLVAAAMTVAGSRIGRQLGPP